MKRILIFSVVSLIVIITGCDNRKDYFARYNTDPIINIKKENTSNPYVNYLYDSLWTGYGNASIYYGAYDVIDNSHDSIFTSYKVSSGSGNLVFDNSAKTFTISNIGFLKNKYEIITTDKFGAKGSAQLELYKISNRKPISKLYITQTNYNANNEINISAIQSKDLDIPYGDYLSQYQYRVGSTYSVTTVLNNINFIAATTGTVMVYLKVVDSMGATSNTDSVKFLIQ